MGVQATVVFADLFGSTGVFESLGNALATEAVTQITTWVGKVCTAHGGTVVKFLGDGGTCNLSGQPKSHRRGGRPAAFLSATSGPDADQQLYAAAHRVGARRC